MPEFRTQFAFKGKRERTSKVNMPYMTYPNIHTDYEKHTWLKRSPHFARYCKNHVQC